MRLQWLVLVALAACTGESKDDLDGDGFLADEDCDDGDKNVNPGATEVCDAIDNNCDGAVDELATTRLFADVDGDGFGDPTTGSDQCVGTAGLVADDNDCDDARSDVNPDAVEDCDAVDLNCDGDPTAGATDLQTFYADADGDGYGDDGQSVDACAAPSAAFVGQAGDCDDAKDTIHPGAAEVCNRFDDDCDGTTDVGATDAVTLYTDADNDTYGDPATGALACPAAGLVANGDDCDDTRSAVKPGVTDRCDGGIDNDCDPSTDEDVLFGDTYYVDADGDSWGDDLGVVLACDQPAGTVRRLGDCDDADAGVNPNAFEVCGGGDEDCDGTVDNQPTDGNVFHRDADADTFGSALVTTTSCGTTAPVGYVVDATDCNDAALAVNPGATEVCDTIDNDCSGVADDAAVDATTWFADSDLDTFGDAAATQVACAQPDGFVADATDCDDALDTTYPGANEICDGGIDNDCDPSTDEALTAVWYRDADADGFGVDSDTVNGCAPPVGYVQASGDCDDTDATVNPTATPNCVRTHCGTISLSETWKPPLTHRVTCDVAVQGAGRPVLTIQAGTRVEFDANTELSVGRSSEGKLVVNGTPTNPARFTSSALIHAPGQWADVSIESHDTGSVLTNLVIDSAGSRGTTPGGLILNNADPRITGLVSTANLGAGLVAVSGAEPLVTDSMFTENTGNGLYIDVGAGLSRLDAAGTQGPSFENNVITDNGDRPVTIPGSHADEIDPSNVLSPNGTEEIELLSGILRFTGTWYDHGLPYVVRDSASINVEDGPAAVLTVDPDVQVFFGINSELTIGVNAEGTLFTGTNTVFTGTPQVVANSLNWRGLVLGSHDAGSDVADLEVAYGGGNGYGNILVVSSAPTLERLYVHDSDNSGVYVSGTAAAPRIRDSLIVDNDVDGVFVEATSGVARDTLNPTFEGNLLTGNGGSSVVFPPNFLGELDPSTQFTGNAERVGVHGGTVFDNALWRKLDDDYEVRGDIQIGGPRNPVVDIDDGVTIYFERDTALRAGLNDDGTLRVNGTAAAGVLFTSADPAPGPGDWEGVELSGASVPAQQPDHFLSYLTIAYAGGSDVSTGGALEVLGRNGACGPVNGISLDHVVVDTTSKLGFYASSNASVAIDGFETIGYNEGCTGFNPGCASFTLTSATDAFMNGFVCNSDYWALPASDLNDIPAGTGNVITSGPIVLDTTVNTDVFIPDLGFPVRVQSNVNVGGSSAPTLTIERGVVMAMGPDTSLTCGSIGQATLFADGVTFTSSEPVPAPGDWFGLTFGSGCAVRLTDSTVEYAGGNGFAAVTNQSCCAQLPPAPAVYTGLSSYLADMVIKDSSSCGLYNFLPNDLAVTSGQLSDFNTVFSGAIGGLGDYCP